MKYKVGQKVKIKEVPSGLEDNYKVGDICKIFSYHVDIYGNAYGLETKNGEYSASQSFQEHQLSPLEKDWDTLEVGDELVHETGKIKTVLGICGRVILLSTVDNPNGCDIGLTKEELIRWGYKIKQPEPVEDIQEMTREEAETELNRLVGKKVKIIKE